MFTGLIEHVGTLAQRETRGNGARLVIRHAPWAPPLVPGESIAVNGACLTAAEVAPDHFACDVLLETLRLTSLGTRASGSRVNLERAMRADGRFGGHLVTGHVDGLGRIQRLDRQGVDWALEVAAEAGVLEGIVLKGSVALDGISLTVTAVQETSFSTHLIPFTWQHTALQEARVGDSINIETDMVGKYVRKYALAALAPGHGHQHPPRPVDPTLWV